MLREGRVVNDERQSIKLRVAHASQDHLASDRAHTPAPLFLCYLVALPS